MKRGYDRSGTGQGRGVHKFDGVWFCVRIVRRGNHVRGYRRLSRVPQGKQRASGGPSSGGDFVGIAKGRDGREVSHDDSCEGDEEWTTTWGLGGQTG